MDALAGARLDLRPFTLADVDAVAAVYGDAEVMRWVGHGRIGSRDGIERMLREYVLHQERHGFSVWAVIERETGELIGDGGLFKRPEGEVELGYTLRRDRWGRGYATEVAGLWVAAALDELRLEDVIAQCDVPNEASARVLEKVGFVEELRRMAYGREHRGFRLRATDLR